MNERGTREAMRSGFYSRSRVLRGRRIKGVSYFVFNVDGQTPWDFGDSHHAELGVELITDQGPVSFVWSEHSEQPYGLDVVVGAMASVITVNGTGPWGVCPENHPLWLERFDHPITQVITMWSCGLAGSWVDVLGGNCEDIPVAVRIDTAGGSVWFVGGCMLPDGRLAIMPGDEVVVVFSRAEMLRLGFPDNEFVSHYDRAE